MELAVRKAAAMDPGNAAALPGTEGKSAKTRREEACYSHVAAVLRVLSDPRTPAPSFLEAFQKSLSTAERGSLREQLLRRVASTTDPLLHESVYMTLVTTNDVRDLLRMDTPYLEPYLVRVSGLSGAAAGVPVGPLSSSQVTHTEVLARMYIGRNDYAAAAGVYELLASRAAGLAEVPDPSLDDRITHLQAAVLQARSCGDAALVDRLEAKVRTAQIQAQLVEGLRKLLSEKLSEAAWSDLNLEIGRQDCDETVAEIKRSLLSLEDLYNDVARPTHRWAQCLELLDISSVSDPPYLRQLWDLLIKEQWQKGWNEDRSGDDEQGALAGLRAAAEAVSVLGEKFYPNEASFPAAAVLLRLEQAAAGSWPLASGISLSSTPAQRALLAACGGSYEPVVRAYESLLSARGSAQLSEELQTPAMRLRLLRSLRDVVANGRDRAADRGPATGYAGVRSGRRELGVLAAACEAFGAEARRLPVNRAEGEALAEEFSALGDSLQMLMGYGGGNTGMYG